MNCVRCQYLLWNLPENRCPECGLAFESTDYAFQPGAVHFVCRDCGQSYQGTDRYGLPIPQHFDCAGCHHKLDAAEMLVRPVQESACGEPIRMGTSWEQRRRLGRVRAYFDSVAALATQPSTYFRRVCNAEGGGAFVFGVLCAYVAAGVFLVALAVLDGLGLTAPIAGSLRRFTPGRILILLAAVPMVQLAWTYVYGAAIGLILRFMGDRHSSFSPSLHVVSFGSAILPAMCLLPPIGLPWYVAVVASGIESLYDVPRSRALIATMLPLLAAGNILMIAIYGVLLAS